MKSVSGGSGRGVPRLWLALAGVLLWAAWTPSQGIAQERKEEIFEGPGDSGEDEFDVAPAGNLNDHCVVSVLNRSAQVRPDGSWDLLNVPTNFGRIRVRATCVDGGVTRSGQSDYFVIPPNGTVGTPTIDFEAVEPIPARLSLSAPETVLRQVPSTLQLQVTATFADGSVRDLSASVRGTSYTSSNSRIASVGENGLLTANSSGTVLITALNEGATALLRVSVVLSGDSDGDGIPDDVELANGLNPNDPVDALEDFDRDGLTNRQELQLGTDLRNADSDGDNLPDGREVAIGTDPLVFDTDGDGLGDGLEVATGSDPLDPSSYNLALALQFIEVAPPNVTLVFNTLLGEASRQLQVTGHLIDGRTLDLTSGRRGTAYASSDLTIVNFGATDGQLFAGQDGVATVTVSNSGFHVPVPVTVRSFAPQPLSRIAVGFQGRGVDVAGGYAYVVTASGSTGKLIVVDVNDRRAPVIRGTLNLPGAGEDVKVVGNVAYVAAGQAGLVVVDVADPVNPTITASLDTPGYATDLAIRGGRLYLADGTGGLRIIDVVTPGTPVALGSSAACTTAQGVDVSGNLAVVACGATGIRTLGVADPAAPVGLGSLGTSNAQDVIVDGTTAYVADYTGSLRTIDVGNPSAPRPLAGTDPTFGGILFSLAKARNFTFGADYFFVNGVPITDVADPASLVVRARLDFPGDATGYGIAVDGRYVYLITDFELFIGQYLELTDELGVPPAATITSPAPGEVRVAATSVTVHVEASDDVAVASVTFSVNGVPVAADFAAPFEFDYTLPLDVTEVTFGATAADFGGNQTEAQPVTIGVTPDPPPGVTLTSPPAGTVTMEDAVLTLEADASDNIGVAAVRFVVNEQQVARVTAPPYRTTYRVPLGVTALEIVAEAEDNFGQKKQDTRSVPVNPDPPPSVTIVNPAAGATAPENTFLVIQATATDNRAVTQVRILVNGLLVRTISVPPYRASYPVPVGASSLDVVAEATDNLGRTAQATREVSVTPDPAPTVSITSPAEGTTLVAGQPALIRATASDNGAVSDVAFVVNGAPFATQLTPPYAVAYPVPEGATTVQVVVQARDNYGHVGEASREFAVAASQASLVVEPLSMTFSTAESSPPVKPAFGLGRPQSKGRSSRPGAQAPTPAPSKVRSGRVPARKTVGAQEPKPDPRPGPLPLRFEANQGQADARLQFLARGRGFGLGLTSDGALLALGDDSVRMRFEDAGPESRLVGLEELPGRSHYLVGSDPQGWRRGIPSFARVRLEELYPGISAVFHGAEGELEYDLLLEPGADPRRVCMAFEGTRSVRLDAAGDLLLSTSGGELRQVKPRAFEEVGGLRRRVEARYVRRGQGRFGIELSGHDRSRPLVVDPVLRYSTYYGGSGSEQAFGAAVDAQGAVYLTGRTTSLDFPTLGAVQGAYSGGSSDGFVVKLDANGSLAYATYYGGSDFELPTGIAVDAGGQAHIVGYTGSRNLPTVRAIQPSYGGGNADAFLAVFDADGGSLVLSTYLGGTGWDEARGVAVDASGNAWVTGQTSSPNFPILSALQPSPGGTTGFFDAFVTKLSVERAELVYSTYLGGTRGDYGTAVAVDAAGSAYVTGWTESVNFPTVNAFDATGSTDAFVSKISPDGTSLVYSTYLGGDSTEYAFSIAVDGGGSAHVVGQTSSSNFPLKNPLRATPSSLFLTKFEPAGSSLAYSTYLAADGGNGSGGVAVDSDGNTYVGAGINNDALVIKLNPSGSAQLSRTQFGGSGADRVLGIALGDAGRIYVAGYTTSTNFPTLGALQPAFGGGFDDVFVARFDNVDQVGFDADAYAVGEAAGEVTLSVSRTDATPVPVSVDFVTVNGTATAPFDYATTSGTLVFAPGETTKTITVPVVDDALVEDNETLQVFLANATGGAVIARGVASVTLNDNDSPPPGGTLAQTFVVRDRVLATGPDWQATTSVPWLTLSESSGFGPSSVTVTADPAGLAVGTHSGEITVGSPAAGSPQTIHVTLKVVGTDFAVEPTSFYFQTDDTCPQPSSPGMISTVAGDGTPAYSGDGGPAVEAEISSPTAVAVDGAGSVFLVDSGNFRVRKIAPDGTITTVAGNGTEGYSGDGGPATQAQIGDANGIAVDEAGSLYIGDSGNNVVRKVAPDGTITTVAGDGTAGSGGDGGPATSAQLRFPVGVTVDGGSLFIADAMNNRVRKVAPDGTIATIAGSGNAGYSGDGGPATDAELNFPVAIVSDRDGGIYVAEDGNNVVRHILSDGSIYTYAGTGVAGDAGDGGWAGDARFNDLASLSIDARGNLYLADAGNNRVRKIDSEGRVSSVAGTGIAGDSGDGGSPLSAQLNSPWSAAGVPGQAGLFYVADHGNHRIRRVQEATGDVLQGSFTVSRSDGSPGPEWHAAATVPWITLSRSSGSGPSTVLFSVDTSSFGCYDRQEGRINVTTEDSLITKTIQVFVQIGPPPG